jgi:hypothetical protein
LQGFHAPTLRVHHAPMRRHHALSSHVQARALALVSALARGALELVRGLAHVSALELVSAPARALELVSALVRALALVLASVLAQASAPAIFDE